MSAQADIDPAAAEITPSKWSWPPLQRRELIVLASACLLLLALGLLLIAEGAPLGHDESVYALRARYWAGQAQDVAWNAYRAEGLPFLSAPLMMVGGSEPELRAVVLAFGVLMVVLVWALARLLFDETTGLIAAALVAVTPATLAYSWQIALDVPSATLGLAATLVFAAAIRGERIRWWAAGAIPLAIAAVYVRYGAPLVVAAGMVGVAVARWPVVWRDWLRALLLAVGTLGGMAAVLLVPPLTNSDRAPGLAFRTRQVNKEIGAFESYGDFAGVLDDVFGPIVGLLVVVGLVAALVRARHIDRASLAGMAVAGLLFIVGLNFSLAQVFAQYVVPLVPFVAIAAAAGLGALVTTRAGAVAVAVVLVAAVVPMWSDAKADVDSFQDRYGVIRYVARELDAVAEGDCIVITSYSPQVGWYSGCPAYGFTPDMRQDGLDRSVLLSHAPRFVPSGTDAYAVLFNRGKRQPTEEGVADMHSYARSTMEFGDVDRGNRQWGQIIHLGPTP